MSDTKTLPAALGLSPALGKLPLVPTATMSTRDNKAPVHHAEYRPATINRGTLVSRALRRRVEIKQRTTHYITQVGEVAVGVELHCVDPTFPPAKYDGRVIFSEINAHRLTFLEPFRYAQDEPPYQHIDLPNLTGWGLKSNIALL